MLVQETIDQVCVSSSTITQENIFAPHITSLQEGSVKFSQVPIVWCPDNDSLVFVSIASSSKKSLCVCIVESQVSTTNVLSQELANPDHTKQKMRKTIEKIIFIEYIRQIKTILSYIFVKKKASGDNVEMSKVVCLLDLYIRII